MMAMEWRLGPEGADTAGSTDRVSGMDLGFIGFIQEMFMLGNGRTGRAMAVEFIPVRMAVDMWVSSSGGSSMDLAIIISEMGTHMLENILQTRCMVLEFTVSKMGIGMREPGMKVEGKVSECIHLEMGKPNLGTGKMEF